jgi:hypothetical protein
MTSSVELHNPKEKMTKNNIMNEHKRRTHSKIIFIALGSTCPAPDNDAAIRLSEVTV